MDQVRRPQATVISLTAVIVAVTDEVPRVLVVRRMTHALATAAQKGRTVDETDSPVALPSGPFEPSHHRTLEQGLRDWVEEQTGLPLRFVEQLYTFGDRYRDYRELADGRRVVSVGYIGLTRQASVSGTGEAEWRDWYSYLPWEDWRGGRPALVESVIQPELKRWIGAAADRNAGRRRRERIAIAFGRDDPTWDFERCLDRYEILYETGLVAEALRDRTAQARKTEGMPKRHPLTEARSLGATMALDNRRVLATALGRLRGKLKYRPVVFDLLPPAFTHLQLQRIVEALSGMRLHKSNFRRLVINGKLVEPTGRMESRTGGRPAELFRFRRDVVSERSAAGVGLPVARAAD